MMDTKDLASMIFKFFVKKADTLKGTKVDSDAVSEKQQLEKELSKLIIRTFKKRKVYYSFRENN